jgi:predicted Zn-dependent peptidase
MRVEGSRDGLTRSPAEAELRRLITETKAARVTTGDALTMAELGRRYLANLERQSRKKATTTAVESILRVWLEPFFAERDLRRITAQDVQDLMTMMEKGERPGPKGKGDRVAMGVRLAQSPSATTSATSRRCSGSPSARDGCP